MNAERIPSILPTLGEVDALEVTALHSIAGKISPGDLRPLISTPPFVAPHHTITRAGLVGGGSAAISPGACSLAHRGILFLDEAPEIARPVIESLREPMESGEVRLTRLGRSATFPARFTLVLASNPCPCGWAIGKALRCTCSPLASRKYRERLSGPILDRIDLSLDVPAVPPAALSLPPASEGTAEAAARVASARAMQTERYAGTGIATNAQADGDLLLKYAQPDAAGMQLLDVAVEKMKLSARAYHRVLRVARTLADLEGATAVGRLHVAESIAYRRGLPGRNGI